MSDRVLPVLRARIGRGNHKALADVARKGTVSRNVADLADPSKLGARPKPEMQVWSPAQLREFLAGVEDARLYPAAYLAANTGMRRGEVLGLRWQDVDFDRGRLSVHKALRACRTRSGGTT